MDLTLPHGKKPEKKTDPKKESNRTKSKKEDEDEESLFDSVMGDDTDTDEDEDEETGSLDDDDSEGEFDEEIPWFKKPAVLIGGVVGLIVVGVAVWFLFFKEEEAPPPPPEEPVEEQVVDQTEVLKDTLYKMGIGKEAVNEKNIYDQGPLESSDFRKDFASTESPETYTLPIEIMAVSDSVSYVKHRTMTDDGMDMYWVDAEYKGKKTRFTVPYYIWRTLASQGVMDVIVETIIDANGKTFIGSLSAVPPTEEE